jgi:hypothetical protein
MNYERFDVLTAVLASKLSRRRGLAEILGFALLNQGSLVGADPSKAKRKGHSKGRGTGHEKGKGRGHELHEQCTRLACETLPVPRGSRPEFCCPGGFCSCGGECCDQACFQTGDQTNPDQVFCCTGEGLVICGEGPQATCCDVPCSQCQELGQSGIAGSYRRPR